MAQSDPSLTDDLAAGPATDKGLKTSEREDLILAQFRSRLHRSRTHRQEWREEARTLYDMAAGRQWDAEDLQKLKDEDRPAVTFNTAGKYLDAVQGLQINNRQEIRYAPREQGDLQVNEVLTGAVAWARDLTQMIDDETDAFYDCILTGEGWMEAYIDRDIHESGVPCGSRVDPLEMFPDPDARKRNYADARFSIRLRQVDPGEYRERYGSDEAEDDASPDPVMLDDLDEDEPIATISQLPQDYTGQASAGTSTSKKRTVADYQWVEREDALAVSTEGFPTKSYSKEEWTALEPKYRAMGLKFEAKPFKRRRFYRAIICGSTIKDRGLSPDQTGFTFKGITGKRDRNKRTWYGIGRSILDPARWTNKFFSTILYAMMTNAKGGLMVEEGAFKDARKAESEWANPGSMTWMKEGAIQKGKFAPKPPANYPQGLDRLMQFSLEALPQTSGLNLEIMGMADRVQAGVVEAQRKQSAMSIIAWAFDAMRRYYYEMGRTLACFVRDYVPEGTLVQVMGENGKQYIPLVKANLQVEFDTIVDEAPSSVNQQERVWSVLQTLIPQLLQAGIKIPKEVIEFAPLPSELKAAWNKELTPSPQDQQVEQQKTQEMLRAMSSENAERESKARLNDAQAQKALKEIQQPTADPVAVAQVKAQADMQTKQMQAQVDANLAQLQADREARTELMITQMQLESKERIAQLEAMIDERLKQAEIQANQQSKITVAGIAAAARGEDAPDEDAPEKPDTTAMLAETIKGLQEALKDKGKRPKGYKIKRDKLGEMESVDLDWGE